VRLCVITSLFPSSPRPAEGIFVERRWGAMQRRGHAVTVVHPVPLVPPLLRGRRAVFRGMAAREERSGLQVLRPRYLHVPGSAIGNARRFASSAITALAKAPPEVAVADYAWPAAMVTHGLRRRGVPVVISGRGSDVVHLARRPRVRRDLAAALVEAGSWVAVARHLVAEMDLIAGAPGAGALVPNGVDLELFGPRDAAACRDRLGLNRQGRLVLVVGHLIPRKAPLDAIGAFARARLAPGRLVYVGTGPLAAQVRAEAIRLGIADAVSLHGEAAPEQLVDWYGAADCLLLCSSFEGRPNVVLEALACGRPVVATDTAGSSELLERFPSLLAPTGDPGAIAERLRAVIAEPPPREALRAEAERRGTWEAACWELERAFAAHLSACGGSRVAPPGIGGTTHRA